MSNQIHDASNDVSCLGGDGAQDIAVNIYWIFAYDMSSIILVNLRLRASLFLSLPFFVIYDELLSRRDIPGD